MDLVEYWKVIWDLRPETNLSFCCLTLTLFYDPNHRLLCSKKQTLHLLKVTRQRFTNKLVVYTVISSIQVVMTLNVVWMLHINNFYWRPLGGCVCAVGRLSALFSGNFKETDILYFWHAGFFPADPRIFFAECTQIWIFKLSVYPTLTLNFSTGPAQKMEGMRCWWRESNLPVRISQWNWFYYMLCLLRNGRSHLSGLAN